MYWQVSWLSLCSAFPILLISGKGEAAVSAITEKDYSCGNSFRFCWRFRITEFPFNSETNLFPKPTPLTFKLQTDQITNNPLNKEYPMSNNQYSISIYLYLFPPCIGNWLFLVGCWALNVSFYTFVMLVEHSLSTLRLRWQKTDMTFSSYSITDKKF